MNKQEWKDILNEYEVVLIDEKVDNEKTVDIIAKIFSSLPTLDWDFEDPISDLTFVENEGYRLYVKAYSIRQAQSWAKKLVKAGYKADAGYELSVPWLRVFNVLEDK